MGIIDDIENADDYSIFPKKEIEERLKDLDGHFGLTKKELKEIEDVAYPNKKETSNYHKAIKIDKDFQDNIHNVELLEEMQGYSRSFDRVMALGYALLTINEYRWSHYGSAKVRKIDAGVKTMQFSQQNINNLIKNRR